MDFHNNDIGREVKYEYFRDHWFWDRWDWREWARRVRDYVNDTGNAEFIQEWKTGNPSESEAWARQQYVPQVEVYLLRSLKPRTTHSYDKDANCADLVLDAPARADHSTPRWVW